MIFYVLEKLWIEKYPSSKFNHISTTSPSICPSNKGISKLTCTLKGVAPPKWLLDDDPSVYVDIHRRIWMKLSKILFLCRARASLSNLLMRSPAPSFVFSSAMGGGLIRRGRSSSSWTSSRPNCLYPNLFGDMHGEITKEKICLIPLIRIYMRKKWKSTYRTQYTDILQWTQRYSKPKFY